METNPENGKNMINQDNSNSQEKNDKNENREDSPFKLITTEKNKENMSPINEQEEINIKLTREKENKDKTKKKLLKIIYLIHLKNQK